jgi:hypothetical protein
MRNEESRKTRERIRERPSEALMKIWEESMPVEALRIFKEFGVGGGRGVAPPSTVLIDFCIIFCWFA